MHINCIDSYYNRKVVGTWHSKSESRRRQYNDWNIQNIKVCMIIINIMIISVFFKGYDISVRRSRCGYNLQGSYYSNFVHGCHAYVYMLHVQIMYESHYVPRSPDRKSRARAAFGGLYYLRARARIKAL